MQIWLADCGIEGQSSLKLLMNMDTLQTSRKTKTLTNRKKCMGGAYLILIKTLNLLI